MILLCCVALALALGLAAFSPRTSTPRGSPYGSNGEQIYMTATSQRGTSIAYDLPTGGMMRTGLTCASCHGPDGRGGGQRMMMRTFVAPGIRFLTLATPRKNDQGEDERIFTEATVKRAITEGVDPDGRDLKWPMPRWSMSDADLDDLVQYLKTLK
jgi:mono/diheme cytochrome c family protein